MAIQKLHEANKDDEQATLNKVKALKELETMDLEHLARLIEMVQALKAGEVNQVSTEVHPESVRNE
jgi:histidyl-tRNA synthetase